MGAKEKEWNKQLAKSAIKQAKIRHLLETLSQSHFKDGKKDSKEIENILKEMKQIEKELVHNRIDQNLMNRVQDISTRLLKAENALKERELSEKGKHNHQMIIRLSQNTYLNSMKN